MYVIKPVCRFFLATAATVLGLTACDNNVDELPDTSVPAPPPVMSYSVTMTNVTNNQVFSPVAAVLHGASYVPWEVGQPVTVGLEMIAEGGDTTRFVAEADADEDVVATAADSGPLMPGSSTTFELETTATGALEVSLATMLIRTNDGFTGVDGVSVADFAVGDSVSRTVVAFDAGTEANTETEDTLVETGEGFNVARDDRDVATLHQGVVTSADGLASSFLDASHRWDNPVARITITRTN